MGSPLLTPEPHKQRSRSPAAARQPFGSWSLLVLAFSILLALTLASGLATLKRATELYETVSDLNRKYRQDGLALDEVRSGIHVSSVLLRDYLLDPSLSRATEIRVELLAVKTETEKHLSRLERTFDRETRDKALQLRTEINGYWESLDPVFDWSPEEKRAEAYGFLRHRVMPRRDTVLALAEEVQAFTDLTFERERAEIRTNEQNFRSFLIKTTAATLSLGALVALISVLRVRLLETRSERHARRTEQAEQEMRRLSHQLVHLQESERRAISRELHDEVGQMLTGLRMELRSLQKLHRTSPEQFDARIEQTRVLLEQTLQSVRGIAMGLRPSMLDDLGLEAALQWQIRNFERQHEIPVTLAVSTSLDGLPDRQITTLYRIAQEALTNCARHSRAQSVSVELCDHEGALRLVVRDDGVGIGSGTRNGGLGLVGIQERVRELSGTFNVQSQRGQGTTITVDPPRQEAAVSYE
ncbi:MAG TPA: histidine kinase [Bryobacteraceae bacterium]|nr:histidine kinase [Bryobacteraceae bacterium]